MQRRDGAKVQIASYIFFVPIFATLREVLINHNYGNISPYQKRSKKKSCHHRS